MCVLICVSSRTVGCRALCNENQLGKRRIRRIPCGVTCPRDHGTDLVRSAIFAGFLLLRFLLTPRRNSESAAGSRSRVIRNTTSPIWKTKTTWDATAMLSPSGSWLPHDYPQIEREDTDPLATSRRIPSLPQQRTPCVGRDPKIGNPFF